jgi:hypothetical protein
MGKLSNLFPDKNGWFKPFSLKTDFLQFNKGTLCLIVLQSKTCLKDKIDDNLFCLNRFVTVLFTENIVWKGSSDLHRMKEI